MTEVAVVEPSAEQLRTEVDAMLGLVDADDINLASALSKLVQKASIDDRPAILRYLFEHPDLSEREDTASKEIKLDHTITEDELRRLQKMYGNVVDSFLELILEGKPEVDEFYQQLGEVFANPVLRDDKVQAFALYWLLWDKRLPYFVLEDGLRMSKEDWVNLGKQLARETAKIRFILASELQFRSETADLILKVVDEHDGLERVRLMSFLIWEVADRERRLEAVRRQLRLRNG